MAWDGHEIGLSGHGRGWPYAGVVIVLADHGL
jgi:hypothetical protein